MPAEAPVTIATLFDIVPPIPSEVFELLTIPEHLWHPGGSFLHVSVSTPEPGSLSIQQSVHAPWVRRELLIRIGCHLASRGFAGSAMAWVPDPLPTYASCARKRRGAMTMESHVPVPLALIDSMYFVRRGRNPSGC